MSGCKPLLQPIATAPELERIMVAGWQPHRGSTRGYWWWHEDVTFNGVAYEHPDATHWFLIALPDFPAGPLPTETPVGEGRV